MKYIKAKWEVSRGNEYDHWGNSLWFLELENDRYPIRQIESYSNGNRLKYSYGHMEDEYGCLGDQAIAQEEGWGTEITKEEFEREWQITSINTE